MAFNHTCSPWYLQRTEAASKQELSRISGSGWLLQGSVGLEFGKIVTVKFALGIFLLPFTVIWDWSALSQAENPHFLSTHSSLKGQFLTLPRERSRRKSILESFLLA